MINYERMNVNMPLGIKGHTTGNVTFPCIFNEIADPIYFVLQEF